MEIKMDISAFDAIVDTHLKEGINKDLGDRQAKIFEKMSMFLTKYNVHGFERMQAYLDIIEMFDSIESMY